MGPHVVEGVHDLVLDNYVVVDQLSGDLIAGLQHDLRAERGTVGSVSTDGSSWPAAGEKQSMNQAKAGEQGDPWLIILEVLLPDSPSAALAGAEAVFVREAAASFYCAGPHGFLPPSSQTALRVSAGGTCSL